MWTGDYLYYQAAEIPPTPPFMSKTMSEGILNAGRQRGLLTRHQSIEKILGGITSKWAETLAHPAKAGGECCKSLIKWCRREELNPRPSHYEFFLAISIKVTQDND